MIKSEIEVKQPSQSSNQIAVGAACSSGVVGGGKQSDMGAAGQYGWLGVTNDPDELELLAHFQRRLQELRANKAMPSDANQQVLPPQPAATDGGLKLTPTSNGKWALIPKPLDVKQPAETEPQLDGVAVKEEVKDDESDALDSFAKASLEAFKARRATKATSSSSVSKRPAGTARLGRPPKCEQPSKDAEQVVKPEKTGTPVKAEKKVKAAHVEISKKDIMNAMPRVGPSGAPPVRYNGAVIYSACKVNAFRVLLTANDKYSEKRFGWQGPKPTAESWKECIKAIDDARKAEK